LPQGKNNIGGAKSERKPRGSQYLFYLSYSVFVSSGPSGNKNSLLIKNK
jgi:hypothetical protein